ncbi:UDP-N-acetylmuramoyl-L-alanine--D-glutamate ligase [Klugiella xanthotipulae]|uniref:UDP-N-acetylmuramoylalanine--D-glutamate ligase n=1 Tax=Klugiella xanthotipulae TaxID=244735 RepID=A0A543HSZ8_9MICO|nr:UDP-N-acetylmuramoyl-L-alanine--D-glutamate ligase [Klugiella xanthotipulae]TQM61476.1 UDP-N-acetylmuramoylalanine--D-glutamate ligase [Klugiella xanthotipulae]
MGETERIEALSSWHDDWSGLRVAVLGLGVTGFAVADTLVELGCTVRVIAAGRDRDRERLLEVIGCQFFHDTRDAVQLTDLATFAPDLVIVSPGYRPDHPLTTWAEASDIPVWGDIQLAWRLRDKVGAPADWITITGTNGKTTTTQLTAHMLLAGGLRVAPVGNIGVPVLDALRDPQGFDVLVVELSSFQLARVGHIEPYSSVCLNIAADHLDWHGSLGQYIADKARVYENTVHACVYNRADPVTENMVRDADVQEGARAISFGLDSPQPSDLGIVDGLLCDRAFLHERQTSALEITTIQHLATLGLAAPHIIQNILAASALARSRGVEPAQIAAALDAFRLDSHRVERIATVNDVLWVDDSKATNPHAASASLRSFESVVWVVGGLLKGVDVDDLVRNHVSRLRAVVVIGQDRSELIAAFRRHAPDVPLFDVEPGETVDIMAAVVGHAASVAQPGDTVLLAPAAASMDQFSSYADRGARFASAVRQLVGGEADDDSASL